MSPGLSKALALNCLDLVVAFFMNLNYQAVKFDIECLGWEFKFLKLFNIKCLGWEFKYFLIGLLIVRSSKKKKKVEEVKEEAFRNCNLKFEALANHVKWNGTIRWERLIVMRRFYFYAFYV